ncbi:MAG: PIN domain-containing protein [Nitrospirae bacterium]|nr:MAG: PIN domain-containing protein [Nitrospirota bacterium]
MVRDRILIDTSIWIAYFKASNPAIVELVENIMTVAEICVPRVVLAELTQGARTEQEVFAIGEFVGAFTILDQKDETWDKTGKLSFQMKRKGISISLVDCYIAVIANENQCKLLTLDKHFKEIKRFIKIELFE